MWSVQRKKKEKRVSAWAGRMEFTIRGVWCGAGRGPEISAGWGYVVAIFHVSILTSPTPHHQCYSMHNIPLNVCLLTHWFLPHKCKRDILHLVMMESPLLLSYHKNVRMMHVLLSSLICSPSLNHPHSPSASLSPRVTYYTLLFIMLLLLSRFSCVQLCVTP